MARELKRESRPDGLTVVTVAVSNTDTHQLLVATSMLDKPGYQEMIDHVGVRHDDLVAIREGLKRL